MTRSPDSLVPSDSGQPDPEKRDDKALTCWQGGEANLRTATEVNAVSASSNPPAIMPIQLDLCGRTLPGNTVAVIVPSGCLTWLLGSKIRLEMPEKSPPCTAAGASE